MKQWMRAGLALAVAMLCAYSAGNAWADAVQGGDVKGASSSPIKTVTVSANTSAVSVLGAGVYILGFKLYANDAGDSCGLYDTALIGTAAEANLIDEWVEATDEETNVQIWTMPYKVTTATSVLTNGICVIYYQ